MGLKLPSTPLPCPPKMKEDRKAPSEIKFLKITSLLIAFGSWQKQQKSYSGSCLSEKEDIEFKRVFHLNLI